MKSFAQVIESVIGRILEDWGLMLVDRAEPTIEGFDPYEEFYVARSDFKGFIEGHYAIVCQEAFLRALAGNLLGLEEDDEEADKVDVLHEMINVLSGNLLTEMYGEDLTFDLTLHEVEKLPAHEVSNRFLKDQTRLFCFFGDDEPIAITFSLENLDAHQSLSS